MKARNGLEADVQLYAKKMSATSDSAAKFEFILMPDLQGMTAFFPDKLKTMFQWVAANKAAENIQAVLTVGDLTQTATAAEYLLMDTVFDYLDPLNTPYLPVIGNHDYDGDAFIGGFRPPATEFNSQLGPSRLSAKSWYGGNLSNSHENYYIKFDIGNYKFLVLALEFLPRDASIAWAEGIIAANSDRKVIVSTHGYITGWSERSTDTSAHSVNHYGVVGNAGQALWDKLIKNHENIIMVVGGHFVNGTVPSGFVHRMSDVGVKGNVVHQVFINYQKDSTGGPIVDNGQGWLMKMRFEPAKDKVYTSLYSPYLNQYDSRVDSFNIGIPSITVQADIGSEGGLYVNKEIRVNDGLYLGTDIPKYSIPTVQDQQKLVGITNFKYQNNILTVPNIQVFDLTAAKVPFVGPNGRLATSDRFRYINSTNRLGVNMSIFDPVTTLDVRGSIGVNYTNSLGYPFFYKDFASATLVVHHSTGNWGLNVSRSDAFANSGANLSFYHTFNVDPHVKAPLPLNGVIGRLSFQAPRNDTSNVAIYGDILVRVSDTSSSLPKSEYIFSTGEDVAVLNNHKFAIYGNGNVSVAKGVADIGMKLWVDGTFAVNRDSTSAVTEITTQDVALWDVNHQIKRASAAVVVGKLSNTATLDFPNTSTGTSADLTITVTGAAVGDVVMLGLPASPDANSCYTGWVSATNTVTVRFNNYSANPIDPASGSFRAMIIKQ